MAKNGSKKPKTACNAATNLQEKKINKSEFYPKKEESVGTKQFVLPANVSLEHKLWLTADKLRNNIDAAQLRATHLIYV